jgi:hypothetical protein
MWGELKSAGEFDGITELSELTEWEPTLEKPPAA